MGVSIFFFLLTRKTLLFNNSLCLYGNKNWENINFNENGASKGKDFIDF